MDTDRMMKAVKKLLQKSSNKLRNLQKVFIVYLRGAEGARWTPFAKTQDHARKLVHGVVEKHL